MFEHKTQPIAPLPVFVRRVTGSVCIALGLSTCALIFGVGGYHWIAGLDWVDAFLDAAMILGGMGPVGDIRPDAGKLFAAFYALYAGLVFLVVATLLIAPIFHRILHRFHLEVEAERKLKTRPPGRQG